jgi:hypothetical protein
LRQFVQPKFGIPFLGRAGRPRSTYVKWHWTMIVPFAYEMPMIVPVMWQMRHRFVSKGGCCFAMAGRQRGQIVPISAALLIRFN